MEERKKPKWDCSDYQVGEFKPESFTPKLKWRITYVGHQNEYCEQKGLARSITLKATVFRGHDLVLHASPYSYGNFACDGYNFGFGGKYYWLDTADPEDAVYRAEQRLLNWARRNMLHYEKIFLKVS